MAKLTGPLLSLGASGTVGRQLNYAATPRGHIARMAVQSQAPGLGYPQGRRAFYRLISQLWQQFGVAAGNGWGTAPETPQATNWSRYVKQNLTQWDEGLGPRIIWPIGPVQGDPEWNTGTLTGGPRRFTIAIKPKSHAQPYYWMLYWRRGTTAAYEPQNFGRGGYDVSTGTHSKIITGLLPGTYHVDCALWNLDPVAAAVLGDATVVVT
jgi:hypothetical protein